MMRKSDSDKAIGSNKDGTSSRRGSKKIKRKSFKRSLTMTSLPLAFFKGCATADPDSPANDNQNWEAKATNNNSVTNATKFTIGTSDESDEDENTENSKDLERLFCPLTDSQGSPLFDPNEDESESPSEIQPLFMGEQLSAVSCRRVQSEILASVSKIKCSLLGRKGGLLHSYGHYGSEAAALNEFDGKKPVSADASPSKSTPSKNRKAKSHQNAITVSLPSPAGNRKTKRPEKKKSNASKNWEKYSKVRKAVKQIDKVMTTTTKTEQPVLKQSASARQLASGVVSPSQSIKRKKKKKKGPPTPLTPVNAMKPISSVPNLARLK